MTKFLQQYLNRVETRLNCFALSRAGRKIYQFSCELAGFIGWLFPALKRLSLTGSRQPRRLLAVYDLTSQPFSIGDILTIQEASLIIREQHGLGAVDFAVLYDPRCSTCVDPAFASIAPDNVHSHLSSILPAAQVNPYHGSLFVFNSDEQLHRFIARHGGEYHVWPTAWKFAMRKYNYWYVFNDLLRNYHKQHGAIPHLSCRPFVLRWARTFYEKNAHPRVPVTVQIRRNKLICPSRNTPIERWLAFFRYCEDHYPVQFVIVCALSEVDDRLRQCRNVTIAKDHGTNIEEDLALIQTAAIHMGASSGPGQLAIFNTKPYLFITPHTYLTGHDIVGEENGYRFSFATPYQRFVEPPETLELLKAEFERMWQVVDLAEWNADGACMPAREKEVYSWLR